MEEKVCRACGTYYSRRTPLVVTLLEPQPRPKKKVRNLVGRRQRGGEGEGRENGGKNGEDDEI